MANHFYVYELVDPRDEAVFYVGKGCKDRDKSHIRSAVRGDLSNPYKSVRISEIMAEGYEVVIRRVHHGLSEAAALRLEREQIALYGLENLTNIVRGNNTEVDRLLIICNDLLWQAGETMKSYFRGEPFTRANLDVLFGTIHSMREMIPSLEAERDGHLI